MPKKREELVALNGIFKELRAEAKDVVEDLAAHIENLRAFSYVVYIGCATLLVGIIWGAIAVISPWPSQLGLFSLFGALIFAALGCGIILVGHSISTSYNRLKKKYSKILELEKSLRR